MSAHRQSSGGFNGLLFLLFFLSINFSSCKVYIVKKSDLEEKLRSKSNRLNLNSISVISSGKLYNNNIDTLKCADHVGKIKTKRFRYDSKITIVTKNNRSIKYYAKTLFIFKDEFLIGERASPSFYGINYYPIKLSQISRIEVK